MNGNRKLHQEIWATADLSARRAATLRDCHAILRGRRRRRTLSRALALAAVVALCTTPIWLARFHSPGGSAPGNDGGGSLSGGRLTPGDAGAVAFTIISERELLGAVAQEVPVAILTVGKRKMLVFPGNE